MATAEGAPDWVPGESTHCGFCLQPVEAASPTACPRCRARYHPDCWKANDSRCAVYGCEPVPAAPPPRPVLARAAARPAAGSFGGPGQGRWPLLGFFGILFVQFFARTCSTSVSSWNARQGVDSGPLPAVSWTAGENALDVARRLIEEARPVLEEVDQSPSLPRTLELRRALRTRVEAALDKLHWAQRISAAHRTTPGDPGGRTLQEATTALERLQKVRIELYRNSGSSE